MASNSISFTIAAKDMASQTLRKIGGALGMFSSEAQKAAADASKLGQSTSRMSAGMVAMGNLISSGVIGGLKMLKDAVGDWVKESFEAEKANTAIDAALRGLGQYTPTIAKAYKDLAGAIQDETGASDESVKQNIAMLASLGVMPSKMAEAARSVEALKALNIDGSMAAKMVAAAMDGNYQALKRLSPAIREAATDQEAQAAFAKLVSAGYEQQTANLNTAGGAYQALTGRIGDMKEELGLAIIRGLGLGDAFGTAQAKIKAFIEGENFKAFLTRLEDAARFAKEIGQNLLSADGFGTALNGLAQIIVAAFMDGGKLAAEQIAKAMLPKKDNAWRAGATSGFAAFMAGMNPMNVFTGRRAASANRLVEDINAPSVQTKSFTELAMEDFRKRFAEIAAKRGPEAAQAAKAPEQVKAEKDAAAAFAAEARVLDERAAMEKAAAAAVKAAADKRAKLDADIAKAQQDYAAAMQKRAEDERKAAIEKRIAEAAAQKDVAMSEFSALYGGQSRADFDRQQAEIMKKQAEKNTQDLINRDLEAIRGKMARGESLTGWEQRGAAVIDAQNQEAAGKAELVEIADNTRGLKEEIARLLAMK